MNTDWQDFLTRHGAVISSGVVQHFGDSVAELKAAADGSVLCDLAQFGTLRVSGEDAQTFLQNLLSNDIREVTPGRAQLSSLNTAKGRMLASLLIWRDGDDYLLQLPQTLCEPIRKKLSMYVLRAKVKVSDASDEVVSLGLSGPNAIQIAQALAGVVPQQPLGVDRSGAITVLRFGDFRFQITTTPQQAQALWTEASLKAQPVGSVCWDWLNIHAGIPVILPQTQEHFVAQMVNFDLIGGVSFNKGCYPGQEIVARTQYLGKLKRRMYLAHIDGAHIDGSGVAPQPGTELFSADMEGQASGVIANVAPAPDGGYDMLAVLQIASHDAYPVHMGSLQGARLQFQPLPYAIS
jgi:folate-binding protein YgfZ